jgi:polynucleotide 5'-hydroxyl-kinase GRC3/NOL9
MSTRKLEIFIKDSHIIDELLSPESHLILVIGGSDTGKTTLVECVADFLAQFCEVGIVDLDIGQSHIGVPATIAWGKVRERFQRWQDVRVEDFYFTGSITPVGSLVPVLTGAKLISDRALSACQKVVVDTTGMITGSIGRVLKQFMIDLLSPDIILALERENELGRILSSFTWQLHTHLHRLPVPAQAEIRGPAERSQFRTLQFKSYFDNTQVIEVSWRKIGIRFTREPVRFSEFELKHRLVSFRDKNNRDRAVGIIEGMNGTDKKLLIRTPLSSESMIGTIVIGETKINI